MRLKGIDGYHDALQYWKFAALSYGGLISGIVLSFFLRVAYLNWGIPGAYQIDSISIPALHPDEPVLINQIRALLQDPRNLSVFTYPPLHAQICAVIAKIFGLHENVDLYFLARSLSVVASVLTVWLVWLIGRRWSRAVGFSAMIFMAVTMEACHQAHWANPESLCTLGIVAAVWFSLRGAETKDLFWAGLCLGLSICAKYFGVLFLHLPLVIGLVRGESPRSMIRDWRRYALFYAAVAGVVILDMGYYLWAQFDRFVDFIQTNSLWAHGRGLFGIHPSGVFPPSYSFSVLPLDMGLPIYVLGVAGLIFTIFKYRQYIPIVVIPLPFWVFLETLNYKPARFSLHLIPFLVLLAAIPIASVWGKGRKWRWAAASVFILVAVYSFIYSFAYIQCLDKNRDPRLKMQQWVQSVGDEPVALIGFDETNYRIGLCQYDRCITFSGQELESRDYRYLVVPEILRDVLDQWADLTKRGYRYTDNDWWPMHPPHPEILNLLGDLEDTRQYRRIRFFENKPKFCGVPMEVIHLPFTYFWISNLRVDIYERTRQGETRNLGSNSVSKPSSRIVQ
jgi:hypothetical protein